MGMTKCLSHISQAITDKRTLFSACGGFRGVKLFYPIPPGRFESGSAWVGGEEGGRKVPAAHSSKTINDN